MSHLIKQKNISSHIANCTGHLSPNINDHTTHKNKAQN